MKQIFLVSLVLLLAVFLLPFISLPDEPLLAMRAGVVGDGVPDIPSDQHDDTRATETVAPIPEPVVTVTSFDKNFYVTVSIGGVVTDMTLKEYLRGIMAGEVPASFPEEALKAQAVAARTYIMRNPNALFCDDYAHCMAYSANFDPRFDAAIEATDGEVLVYNDEPILAVFFSTSSGQTENAADVWGGEYPYLVAVDCIGGDGAPRSGGTVTVMQDEFWSALGNLPRSETPFGMIKRSPSGGVLTIEISGAEIKGTEIRSLFGLNSTNFTVALIDGDIVFETKGFGHGVGMPQYGARAMALEGYDYVQILTHYYTGARLERLE
jgi:stage II sporulation protein D